MYIKLTTITWGKQHRDFRVHTDELELLFDLLTSATRLGETVISVSYIDQKGEIPLPIETVHPPFSANPFAQLKQQWESVLAPSVVAELNTIKLKSRRNGYLPSSQQKQLDHHQQVLKQMQQLLAVTHIALTDGPRKKRLIDLHQRTIQRCQQSIAQLEALIR